MTDTHDNDRERFRICFEDEDLNPFEDEDILFDTEEEMMLVYRAIVSEPDWDLGAVYAKYETDDDDWVIAGNTFV